MLCTVIGTVVLFIWQTISNGIIPWHAATMKPFADTTSTAARVIMREAPTNGVYYSNYGVLTDFQTWVCSLAMLLGRLEVFTLLVLFTPALWRK